jgi:hypothetical protein
MDDTKIMYKLMIQMYVSFQVFTAGVTGLFWVLNAVKDNFVATSRRNVETDLTAHCVRTQKTIFRCRDIFAVCFVQSSNCRSCEKCHWSPPFQCAEFGRLFFFKERNWASEIINCPISNTVHFSSGWMLYFPNFARCYTLLIWPNAFTLPLCTLGRWWFCVPLTCIVHSVGLDASLRSAY